MRLNRQELGVEARIMVGLAWPVVLTSLNWTLMHLIDVAVVGHAGSIELAKLAASRTLTYVSIVFALTGLTGVLVFVSRADGAGRPEESGTIFRQGMLLGLLLGAVLTAILLIWPEELLLFAGVPPELAGGGAEVVRAMALAYPAQMVLSVCSFFLEGASRPRRVAVVNVAMLPLNALLAWAWTHGGLGFPAMGAVGAALATACASTLGAIAIMIGVWTLPDAARRNVRDLSSRAWREAWAGVPALARFGTVPAIGGGLELAGFSYLIALSTQLGADTAGAFQAVFSLHNFTFALALGMGSAAGVRVGNAVGAGELEVAQARGLLAAGMAAGAMAITALILWAGADQLVQFASSDPAITALAAALLVLLTPFMLFDGVQIVFTYALRSLGDQVAAGINGIIAFFLLTGGAGWLLLRQGYGGVGLIYAIAIGMVAAALLQGGRFLIVTRRLSRSSA